MSHTMPDPRRAYRDTDDRLLGGVAAGLAEHLGLATTQVRVGFVILALMGGFGAVVYAALWALLPARDPRLDGYDAPGLASATRRGFRSRRMTGRRDWGVAVSLAVICVGVVVGIQNAGLGISPRVFWPLLVAAAGLVLLWQQADESERADWLSTGRGWRSWLRVGVGLVLLVGAVTLALFQAGVSGSLQYAFGAIVLAALGVGLVLGPWLLRVRRDLQWERTERVRSEERADVAAHLHDSVLQTLALIQRQSGDPQAVSQLARTQERELRTWLFGSPEEDVVTVKSALQQAAAEVEDAHQVPVEVVVVGDAAVQDGAAALVAAAREAMVNAAKHSGDDQVDVYAEVGADGIEAFVRDRGVGFESDAVAGDRYGIRHSVIDRVSRHGGHATIKSKPGSGTEVRLWMPTTDDQESRS